MSEIEDDDDDNDRPYVQPPSMKKIRVDSVRSLRERKPEDKKGPLYFLLDYVQKILQKYGGKAH